MVVGEGDLSGVESADVGERDSSGEESVLEEED